MVEAFKKRIIVDIWDCFWRLSNMKFHEFGDKNLPLEQVWAEIRKRGFKNKMFKTLNEVIDKLQEVIRSLHWTVLLFIEVGLVFDFR